MNYSARTAPILSDRLSAVPGVSHGFFTREGGVSTGIYAGLNCGLGSDDDQDAVRENRRRVAEHIGTALEAITTLYQVHGADVIEVTGDIPGPDKRPRADGAVTAEPNRALAILTADCAPVLFADPESGTIGACHAGWRGAIEGVVENTVAAMERLCASRKNILAAVGPCIGQASYQVGPEFHQQFMERDSAFADYFRPDEEGRFRFDLRGFVTGRLAAAGISGSEAIDADTCADPARFFSYRRTTRMGEPDYGRMISVIMRGDED